MPDIVVVYHSGFDSEHQGPYPGDDKVNSADRGVDCFIKSLRENNWDASRFALPGGQSGNPCSPHYADQLPLWLRWQDGEGVPIAWSPPAVAAAARETLRLEPQEA